jgi:glutamate racemase
VLLFDSGVGGLSILDAMAAARLPVIADYCADNAWLPYGDKPDDALRARVPQLVAALVNERGADLVVLACNTASTVALEAVREAVAVPVVGVVPPIKPAAAMTTSGVIALLATPATIARAYTDDLIARFASHVQVVRCGSTILVSAAEHKLARGAWDAAAVRNVVDNLFSDHPAIDVVALACTHFPLLRTELEAAGPPGVAWLDSGEAIARRVREVLAVTEEGALRTDAALFTGAVGAYRRHAAFVQRGFAACTPITIV